MQYTLWAGLIRSVKTAADFTDSGAMLCKVHLYACATPLSEPLLR